MDVNFNTPQIATSNKEISEDIDYFVRSLVSEAQSILSKNNITTSTIDLANYTKSSRKKTYESKKICKFCKKSGHLINKCYKKKGIENKKAEKSTRVATFSTNNQAFRVSAPVMDWIFDDGATDHYCGNYELLKNPIKLKKTLEVKTASHVVRATHQGCVDIRLENGKCLVLKCWYLPNFNINLVSRHKLSLMGFKSRF